MNPLGNTRLSRICVALEILVLTAVLVLALNQSTCSCTIAVVSAHANADGRPILWKNSDISNYWHQQVKYFAGNNSNVGGYYILYNDSNSLLAQKPSINPQAGANQAGFALAVAPVTDSNLLNESVNYNTRLLHEAIANCTSIIDFEQFLETWSEQHYQYAISANYAAIDAQGGAALLEVHKSSKYSSGSVLQYKKFDANTGQVTDHRGQEISPPQEVFRGFHVRSNANSFFPNNPEDERNLRAQELLASLACPAGGTNKLTSRKVMHLISKDVNGKQPANGSDFNYNTTYCISRSQTRSGIVVEGVPAGGDQRLTVFWAALGEPSISVYVPTIVGAEDVSLYLYQDSLDSESDKSDLSILNTLEDERETYNKLLYSSNRGNTFLGPHDYTINKNELAQVQEWTFAIEDNVVDRTEDYLALLRQNPEHINKDDLRNFQNYCAWYIYKNYAAGSAEATLWEYEW